ncbi:serine/threonine protein kinase [Dactylosporangium vinaceum]|uniref:non-specific serine/threonine protein kinase n=1 Tax=Dactylosporangium vinaceum TaxID=53362 RepID=A0ABV5MK10_9ACTN|nr:serine/threonine-protein kinase [Dactylosporangium vinaceum]UAB92761.1 serine/threonine protein kinase [Dactylosporangium vinaceum]
MTNAAIAPPHIDGYRYVGRIDGGGHSEVFRYRQVDLDREVAVKVLAGAAAGARVHEAKAMARLGDHPNIVQVFSTGVADGHAYIIMALCPGADLSKLLANGPFDVRRVLRIGVQIAGAVRVAHKAGILHRDIKPANILTDEYGPQLTDFGIAGQLVATPGEEAVGLSLPWAPREVVRGERGDVAADVYSLGATLWNLLTGRSPFEVPGRRITAAELEQRILTETAPPTGRPDVPPSLERLLARMLDPRPGCRPSSAGEVEAELIAIERAGGGPVAADAPWPVGTVPTRPAEFEATTLRGAGEALGRTTLRPVPPQPPLNATGRPLASTVHRAAPPQPAAPAADTELAPPSRRFLWTWGIATAVVVAAALAVPLAGRGGPGPEPEPTAQNAAPQDAGAGGDVVPPGPVEIVGARVDAGTVRFTWTYSAALDTDTFAWRTADNARSGVADEPELQLPDPAGTEVCLQVKVVRADGRDGTVDWPKAGCVR